MIIPTGRISKVKTTYLGVTISPVLLKPDKTLLNSFQFVPT